MCQGTEKYQWPATTGRKVKQMASGHLRSKQNVEAHEVRSSLWGNTMFLAAVTYEKTPTCAVHDKKRSHTLLNEDGDPGKNNNLELNTDVEYRAERMRK